MESLREFGWNLSPEWEPSVKGQKAILNEALNTDLKEIGVASLSDILDKATDKKTFSSPTDRGVVLQISKIRNVAAPKANEDSGVAPRMLKITLTDGSTSINGIESSRLDKLSLKTPPGTKVHIPAGCQIPYCDGLLHLSSDRIKVLGGKVEQLVEKWEISRKFAQFPRAKPSESGGPPSWIPFGKRISQQQQPVDKNFKALKQPSTESDQPKESNADFDSQRQDAIEEAAKKAGKKVFGGGKAEVKEASNVRKGRKKPESTPAETANNGTEEPESKGRGRKGGRRNRGNDEEDAGFGTKPSAPASLFDFVEKEFPGAHDTAAKPKPEVNGQTEHHERGSDRGQRRPNPRAGTKNDITDKRPHDREAHNKRVNNGKRSNDAGAGGHKGRERSSHQEYQSESGRGQQRGQQRSGRGQDQGRRRPADVISDRDYGEWNNSTYQAPPRRHQQQQQQNQYPPRGGPALEQQMANVRISSAGPGGQRNNHQHQHYPNSQNQQHNQRHPDSRRPRHQQQQHQQRVDGEAFGSSHHRGDRRNQVIWREGMSCLAKYWEDKQFYPATITGLTARTAVVFFSDYGNHEEVMLEDLMPVSSQQQAFIPPTPGLPLAFSHSYH